MGNGLAPVPNGDWQLYIQACVAFPPTTRNNFLMQQMFHNNFLITIVADPRVFAVCVLGASQGSHKTQHFRPGALCDGQLITTRDFLHKKLLIPSSRLA